jgi:hypothetical protein
MRKNELQGFEHVLLELFDKNNPSEAPHKTVRYGKHFEATIAIGKDEIACITMSDDAYKALKTLTESGIRKSTKE